MIFDTIVIGAGAMGSSAAYWLSKTQDVLLIEQFNLLHSNGSSHGQSRIIRKTYREDYYAEMMGEAYKLWKEIEKEAKKSIYRKTGGLDFGKEGNKDLKSTLETCEKINLNYDVLDSNQLNEKFPAYNLDDSYYGIYQPDTGIINATEAVNILQTLAARNGTQIIQNQPVFSIKDRENLIQVHTNIDDYLCKSLVITPGSWINNVLVQFDIKIAVKIWKLSIAYFKTLKPELFKADSFPIFIAWDDFATNYGFPINERDPFVKIAPHYNDLIPKVDENDNKNHQNQKLLDTVSEFVSETFRFIDTIPRFAETCRYTMTSNEDFLIDYLPENPSIVIAGGFSGHGFKFTPIIGKIVSNMIMREHNEWDLDQFKIKHFIK